MFQSRRMSLGRIGLLEDVPGRGAVFRNDGIIAPFFQDRGQDAPRGEVVFGDQDFHGFSSRMRRFQQIELPLQFRHEGGDLFQSAGLAGLFHLAGHGAQGHAAHVGRRALDGVRLLAGRSGVTAVEVSP